MCEDSNSTSMYVLTLRMNSVPRIFNIIHSMGNFEVHCIQLISLNRNPVNRNFRKWVGCKP